MGNDPPCPPVEREEEVTANDLRPSGRVTLLACALLTVLVVAVFSPILGFDFIMGDADLQVTGNPWIQGLTPENVAHILTSRCVSSYYPVRTLSYAANYEVSAAAPWGYKLTNGLIHLANVLLVFWLTLRLLGRPVAGNTPRRPKWDLSAAAFSAGLFAVHPVVVEPVAWVPGREELLMTLGALACLHFHLGARRMRDAGSDGKAWAFHGLAALGCAFACLSNAVGAVIPLLITAWDLITLERPRLGKIMVGTLALWAIGAATIVVKRWGYGGDTSALAAPFSPGWLMMILQTYWLNVCSLVWPTQLALSYESVIPRGFLETGVIFGGLAMGLSGVVLWRLRRRKVLLFGLVWLGLAMAPTLQILPHHVLKADRFLYLPLVGLAVVLAAGIGPLGGAANTRKTAAGALAAGVCVLLALVFVSVGQVRTWRHSVSVFTRCVEVGPDNATAHGGLADSLARLEDFAGAIRHYEVAYRLNPYDEATVGNFALALMLCEEHLRNDALAIEVAERACQMSERADARRLKILALAHVQAGHLDRASTVFEIALRTAQAAGQKDLARDIQSARDHFCREGLDEDGP
ncbi:MAG: tetratricopeptide repeat protein [Planctomycetota bacterium]|jgi:tetratricopeptide (TPR) repeat protein